MGNNKRTRGNESPVRLIRCPRDIQGCRPQISWAGEAPAIYPSSTIADHGLLAMRDALVLAISRIVADCSHGWLFRRCGCTPSNASLRDRGATPVGGYRQISARPADR